ncbi:MAG: restriction endonuclease subunit S, partial [Proteobacteria bacterium]|nr:restriction endonuclease subunit S [Pseudomonadota bacterium]
QLAVQGKLVPQDPDDEPASELLKRIEAEKKRLVEEGKIRKAKPLPPINLEEVPYELPEGWEWARMQEISIKLGSGSTPRGGKQAYVDEGVKFLRSQNIWNDGLRIEGIVRIPQSINEKMSNTIVQPKDILLNITGASIGRSSLVPDDFDIGNVSQHVAIIRLVDPSIRRFLHICLISPLVQQTIIDVQVGISREGLSMTRLRRFMLPLPPLAEQKRIVAKVDQLMALCDALEAKLGQAEVEGRVLVEAVLAGVGGESASQ